uniref:WD_REPEATS_REGION domain-containing protein n=1 Tax=Trichobilharzia regenti TaxID=157069 RepID=A0AA85JPC4_TRIRE|nr:unnamed protein product [Trichobilharzia regenti]
MGSNISSSQNQYSDKDLLQTCSGHTVGINCLALCEKVEEEQDQGEENFTILASGSDDGVICLWQSESIDSAFQLTCTHCLSGHQGYITGLVFHKKCLISASSDSTIRKWNYKTGKCERVFTGHTDVVRKILCANDYILSASHDKTAICWNFRTGQVLNTFKGHTRLVNSIAYYGTVVNLIQNINNNTETVSTTSRFEYIYTGSADHTAKSWSLKSSKCMINFEGHTKPITTMEVFKDGEILLTSAADNTIRSWFTESGVPQFVFVGHKGIIVSMHINSANKMLFTGSIDHTARSWSIETGKPIRTFSRHGRAVNYVRNYKAMLITASSDGYVRLFDEKTGELLKVLMHTNKEGCVAFEIYQNYLFSASNDGKIYVWRYSTNEQIIETKENGNNN